MGGLAAAELVVVDDGAVAVGQPGDAEHIVVRAAGAAVQYDQRHAVVELAGEGCGKRYGSDTVNVEFTIGE